MRKKGWKCKPRTPEHIEKLRQARLGTHHTPEVKAQISAKLKGKVFSEETRKRISAGNTGKVRTPQMRINIGNASRGHTTSKETKTKISLAHIGKSHSKEHRLNQSADKHWNWRGGITPKNKLIRHSLEYKLWRKAVFKRDNYTCVWCGTRGRHITCRPHQTFCTLP